MDQSGAPVDWWFVYKLPDGFDYAYRDANTPDDEPLAPLANMSLNCTTTCALGSTLHQIYRNKSGIATVLYNDEPPSSYGPSAGIPTRIDGETAHAKGVLAYDGGNGRSGNGGGFWLIHSVPKFPDLTLPAFTWTASTTYGQSFLCMTLDAPQIDRAAYNLRHVAAQIFSSSAPWWLLASSPNMSMLVNAIPASGADADSTIGFLTTRAGVEIDHFAKSASWGQDLYEDLVRKVQRRGERERDRDRDRDRDPGAASPRSETSAASFLDLRAPPIADPHPSSLSLSLSLSHLFLSLSLGRGPLPHTVHVGDVASLAVHGADVLRWVEHHAFSSVGLPQRYVNLLW